ncbi:hypothetical protein [Nitrosomonas oligotropha]|nr:hypothetical protein [Nitrosomonas oligotropha]
MDQDELAKKTLTEVIRSNAKQPSNKDNPSNPTSLLDQWYALKLLDKLQSQYEKGDNLGLMRAVQVCARHRLIMPQWAAQQLIHGIDKILSFESKDWNDVLGSPFPKNTQLAANKKKEFMKFAVFQEAKNMLENDPTQPIDSGFYEKAGEKIGIGKTLSEEYCHDVEVITGGTLSQYKKILLAIARGNDLPKITITFY